MNRRLLIQVTTPAVLIGLLLFGACILGIWNISRLQADLTRVLSQNVKALQSADDMQIYVRQLRFRCLLYLTDPSLSRLQRVREIETKFEEALRSARENLAARSSDTPQQAAYIEQARTDLGKIEDGYRKYHADLEKLQAEVHDTGPVKNLQKIADAHPVDNVVEPCLDWLKANQAVMQQTANDSELLSRRIRLTMVLLGILGPASGLIGGYGVARGLSRSIYQLSVSLQGAAQRLDQEIASVSIEGDGDLQSLDRQIQHVVSRVEEVAERVRRHEREMLRAEQLAAVGQLAAGVAHEVRNPLTSVKLLVESALTSRLRKPLTDEDLRVIHAEIVRLEEIVQSFLDFARPPAPERNYCDLRELMTQGIDLSRARARLQGVAIDVAIPSEPVVGNVDPGQIRTVLVNLFINALDAMPQGGRLEVSLEQATGGDVCMHVNDTGEGIAPEMVERLFTPFSSSKPTGTGLGLSISRRIIEEHGGQITADNGDRGARFTIRLPALVPEETHAETVGGG